MHCVITGATGGFGRAFAHRLASLGYGICAVARDKARLEALKAEIEPRYGVAMDILPADLGRAEAPAELHSFTSGKAVDLLVNCAGIARGGLPGDARLEDEMAMLDVNVRATHALTRLYLGDMVARNEGRVLNVASLSAWTPVPGIAAYAAGKAYILSFSAALNFELRRAGSKVRVCVATPGFYDTGIAGEGYRLRESSRSLSAYAERAIKALGRGKDVIAFGRDAATIALARFIPRERLMALAFGDLKANVRKP